MMVFETARLQVRKANRTDIDFYYTLWNSPEVMKMVGFPNGLQIDRRKISKVIQDHDDSVFDQTLVVVQKATGKRLGECKLGAPDKQGFAATDVKLLPGFWGQKYGQELKDGLCRYLFFFTSTQTVAATPNKNNVASQKMQTACGGECVGEDVYQFPDSMRKFTEPVPYFIYHIRKENWEKLHRIHSYPWQDLQPSQLFLNEDKLHYWQVFLEQSQGFYYEPVPIKKIGTKAFLTDGHSRAFALWQQGKSTIKCIPEEDELHWEAYRICVQWCRREHICQISDLANRIIDAKTFQKQWIHRCESMHQTLQEAQKWMRI